MKVYEAVAQALVAEGCGPIFGLMGDGNLSLWGALGRDERVQIYSARNEAGAVAMADGYHRATGKVGICTITQGPGLTQTGTSLVAAARNRSAVVIVTGDVPAGEKNRLQSMDQRRFVEACSARYHLAQRADSLAEDIAEAFYAAQMHRAPVVLAIPMDLSEKTMEWDFDYRASGEFVPSRIESASEAALAPIAEALARAQRPVIIAGRGARVSGARDGIIRLAERVGALLGTSLQNKGYFAGQEYDIGVAGAYASAAGEKLFADADFVLGIGAELGYYTSEGGLLFPQAEVARIDVAHGPEEIGILPGLYARGDARASIAALDSMLEQRQVRQSGFRTAEALAVLNAAPAEFPKPDDGLDPRRLMQVASRNLPNDVLVTCGIAHFAGFPAMYLELPAKAEMHFSLAFGGIGQTLPVSIGRTVGSPGRPHLVIEGDGSLFMNLQELETAARHRIPIVVLVWNDGGLGAEVHKLRKKGFNPALAQWNSPDYVGLARALGGDGVVLESEDALADALAAGFRAGTLFVIDARVSPTTLSDSYGKIHFGQDNQAPRLGLAKELV